MGQHDVAVPAFNVLSICSGYGGVELGLDIASGGAARCVCYVEREAAAAAVLVKEMEAGHLDPAPDWTDLATFDARPWAGVVDCVTAGFPCQPASVAGARLGTSDPRWLWPLVAGVIEDCAPSLVFLENVPGLRTKGMRDVLEDLAALGFDAEWGCLSAAALGAPQSRDRLWILAYRNRVQLREQSRRWGWTGGAEASESGRGGEGVAGADGEGQRQPEGAESDLRRRLGDEGAIVVDTEGQGHAGTIASGASQEDSGPTGPGPKVDDPDNEQRDGPLPEREHQATATGQELGDPSGKRREGAGRVAETPGEPMPDGSGEVPWPPGPDCTDWPEDEPQPAIRREAHGSAFGLGVELRNLGNGVVPVVAAYAFRALVLRAIGEEQR